MKMQFKTSHKVITGTIFLVGLLFLITFKVIENIERAKNVPDTQIKSDSLFIDLIVGDKLEALKKFITGWQEVKE